MSDYDLHSMSKKALGELGDVFARTDPDMIDRMCDEILAARRIACYGVGREGLMMKALCMRLMHL
jgi:6-phospho-3-hexuloisomerase